MEKLHLKKCKRNYYLQKGGMLQSMKHQQNTKVESGKLRMAVGVLLVPCNICMSAQVFFYPMNLKWLIENQTFLTVYFHFPKLSPSSDRIVNLLCCLRCKGHHGTILRCQGTRGLEGQLSSHEGYQFKISPTEKKDAFSMADVWHQVHQPPIQSVSCLCTC